jgi:uncharacterized protein
MYSRILKNILQKQAFSGKILFVLGPRQVGKTTLAREIVENDPGAMSLYFDGDYLDDARQLQFTSRESMDRLLSGYNWIYIDEGQKIPNIGNILKMMVDAYQDTKQIIVTGSSSLNLLDMTNEPLTGRKRVHELYPISWKEFVWVHGLSTARKDLEKLLIFGSYPEVLSYPLDAQKIEHLREITSGQLYRDILEFQDIKKSGTIVALLELLALRVGSEISYHSLAQLLGISQITVERYIDLLEKSFVVFQMRPYFTNKEKEVVKMKKIYFYDLWVRNAILRAFQPLSLRADVGALFENFFVLERLKKLSYEQSIVELRFWRTHKQQEVDLLEIMSWIEQAYEVKWQTQSYTPPSQWQGLYPEILPNLITRDNFWEFL